MFTIEVKKKAEDEEFSFKDLEMFHQECMGGEIIITESGNLHFVDSIGGYILTCQRCGAREGITFKDETSNIIKTAIDGQERKIRLACDDAHIIKVVQKN